MDARGGSRYDEVYARTARRRNMSAPDASGEANRLASAQGARSAQAAQIANIAARLERLPLTSYQKVIFAIIATAAAILTGLGFEHVWNLKTGMLEWNAAQLPVER